MGQAFVPGLRVQSRTTLRVVRELPVQGDILVQQGDRVSAEQIVARAQLPGDVLIVRLAEKMGIEPSEVNQGLRVRVGDEVKSGQILCSHAGLFGLFRTEFPAPIEGRVDFFTERTGHLGIRLAAKAMNLTAYLAGKVVAVTPGRAVSIESQVAFVQGIFGVGGERFGRLKILDVPPNAVVTAEHLPAECRECILVGGARPTLSALQRAATLGVSGWITGSIDDGTLAGYLGYDLGIALTGDEAVPFTLIITEGFGELAIAERTMAVLGPLAGHRASMNGATQVRAGALRPEVIVTLDGDVSRDEAPQDLSLSLEIGSSVRLIRVPYFGERGRVTALPEQGVTIETGAHARVAKILLTDGREVTVPRANLELI